MAAQADVPLIVGGDSTLGRALCVHLRRAGGPVLATTRRPATVDADTALLDLTQVPKDWRPPAGVTVAYLCAAVTSLDQCRRDPAATRRANVDGMLAVATALRSSGVFVVFPSTNLVFDGNVPFRLATDPVCPQTEYGRQKAEVEQALVSWGEGAAVVRFTKVLSAAMGLVRGWVEALRRGEVIHPFSDMVMSPVPLSFAVEVLHAVGRRRAAGITQVSAERDITYEQLAQHIAARVGADEGLVRPVRAVDAGLPPESVPRHTTLDTRRLMCELSLSPPTAWDAVDGTFGYLWETPLGT